MKVKTVLVSQPEPNTESSPYHDIANKFKVKIDFRPFIHVEGLSAKDVRAQKIDFNHFTSIIFTGQAFAAFSLDSKTSLFGCFKV